MCSILIKFNNNFSGFEDERAKICWIHSKSWRIKQSRYEDEFKCRLRNTEFYIFAEGIPTTLIQSGQQWDFPNVWPPLEHMIITGCKNKLIFLRFIISILEDRDTAWYKSCLRSRKIKWEFSNYSIITKAKSNVNLKSKNEFMRSNQKSKCCSQSKWTRSSKLIQLFISFWIWNLNILNLCKLLLGGLR